MGVAVGRKHLEHAVAKRQHGHIEGATAEVEDQHGLIALVLAVDAVCECSSGRFVDDPQNLKPGDGASFFGSGALRIIEVRGHSNDRLGHVLAKVRLGVSLQLLKNTS